MRAYGDHPGPTAAVAGGAAALGYALALRPWLLLDNAIVFVKGQFEGGPGGDVPGRTVTAAAAVLLAYLLAVLVTAGVTFSRRDVR